MDFIFMLTHQDRTVEDPLRILDEVASLGLRHIGFKDVGASPRLLAQLTERIREAGAISYMEVVSTDPTEACTPLKLPVISAWIACSVARRWMRFSPFFGGARRAISRLPEDQLATPPALRATKRRSKVSVRPLSTKAAQGLICWRFDPSNPTRSNSSRRRAADSAVAAISSSRARLTRRSRSVRSVNWESMRSPSAPLSSITCSLPALALYAISLKVFCGNAPL